MGDEYLKFQIGDLVSRKSHQNDVIFKIIQIEDKKVYLQGVYVRLFADAPIEDLVLSKEEEENDEVIIQRNLKDIQMDRSQYFYLPGRILHIDGDDEYLDRCMKLYQHMGIPANGLTLKEKDISLKMESLLQEYRPDIVVITGHDAYYSKRGDQGDIGNYQNTKHFISAVKAARKIEKSQDKLIVIAGACQSNYEELIKAGANFASSPKRINIHALDPAILASSIAFSSKNENIDLMKIIEKTKYGSDGMGGIITNGTMYVGYPR